MMVPTDLIAPVAEQDADTAVQPGALGVIVGQYLVRAHGVVVKIAHTLVHPAPQQVVVDARVHFAECTEAVIAHCGIGRTHDPAVLVDPHRGRHVGEPIQLGEQMIPVHQHGEREALLRCPFPHRRLVCVERNSNHGEPAVLQLIVQRLPDRQLPAAASPTAPGK